MLQILSRNTETNFIPTKPFLDNNENLLRAETMKDDIHYNDYGMKILAKAIMKSLYSDENIGSNTLSNLKKLWREQLPATE